MDNILVVASHPDDCELGCGGTIARRVREGDRVGLLVLSNGVSSRYPPIDAMMSTDRELYELECETRYRSSNDARRILGIKDTCTYEFPDNKFDTVPLLNLCKRIEGIIKEMKASVVYSHFEGDLNIDHQLTARAVLTACRPGLTSVRELYSFEVPSSTEWNSPYGTAFRPNCFVELSEEDFNKKMDALACYEKETREYPHPRSPKAIKERVGYWGTVAGVEKAEPFMQIRRLI